MTSLGQGQVPTTLLSLKRVIVIPFFTEVMIDEQERTAVRMVVEPR